MTKVPGFERMMVRVDEVDPGKREVHVVDKTGSRFKATYRATESAFQIPQQGETWTIERHGYTWYVEKRIDRGTDASGESTFTESLGPGDVHLRAPSTLHIRASGIQIGAQPFGATTREIFNSGTPTIVLASQVVHADTVQVFVNGVYFHDGTDYTLSGQTITFASTPVAGHKISVHYQFQGSMIRDSGIVEFLPLPSAAQIP